LVDYILPAIIKAEEIDKTPAEIVDAVSHYYTT
jgi:hypothetical protein